MPEQSAGILAYRHTDGVLEVLLVHPGGPLWAKKDAGAWSVPKGLLAPGEDPLEAARREFAEETGFALDGEFLPLGSLRQPSGKVVHVWAVAADVDVARLRSNLFELEWPPRSGKRQQFPEVDRAGWFPLLTAREKILKGQREFLERLSATLG
jgi:predicted NUDIX family NTP pyrophosphohydrolase